VAGQGSRNVAMRYADSISQQQETNTTATRAAAAYLLLKMLPLASAGVSGPQEAGARTPRQHPQRPAPRCSRSSLLRCSSQVRRSGQSELTNCRRLLNSCPCFIFLACAPATDSSARRRQSST